MAIAIITSNLGCTITIFDCTRDYLMLLLSDEKKGEMGDEYIFGIGYGSK